MRGIHGKSRCSAGPGGLQDALVTDMALKRKESGERACAGGNTQQMKSIQRYLHIMVQNCAQVCPGSFHVSANNAALGNHGTSAALAINHPLTVPSWEGGNCSHVLAVKGPFLCSLPTAAVEGPDSTP